MADAGDVSFELERFEWTADDRLVVVGRWNGVSGRRLLRPALNVDAGGRRTRVTGSAEDQDPWRATFDWDAARGDVVGAELELGRSLVVELPPPRRRRRRSAQVTAENDLRAALAELKAERDSLRLELEEQPDVDRELAAARAELESLRDERPDAALLAASRAEVERLTRELEALRADADASRADAERLASKVESLRADAAALVETRAELERVRAQAGERLATPDESAELAALRAEVESLRWAADEAAGLRAEVAQARSEIELLTADAEALAAAQAELEAARAEAERLAAELAAVRSEAPKELDALRTQADVARAEADELAGLRLAHGSLKAAHEQLEDELEGMRAMREERDALALQVQQLRAQTGDEENQRAALGELIRGLQEQTTAAEDSNERLTNELAVAREDIIRLQGLLAAREETLTTVEAEAEHRVETERMATTEVHERLATAREEAQRSIVAEAEETERLRAELDRAREDGERLLAAERAEVARLREELLNSEVPDGAPDEASRRMVERLQRDLDRERAATRTLRRELEVLRAESAEERRSHSNGTIAGGDATIPAATPAGRRGPVDAPRRVAAARSGAAHRVPSSRPNPIALWSVRFIAFVLIVAMAVALVYLVQQVMP
jgi:chromosome segregation ATPase